MHLLQYHSAKWTIEKLKPARLPEILHKWHLDEPIHQKEATNAEHVLLRGWALGRPETHAMLHLVVRIGTATYCYPLLEARHDVVKIILNENADDNHPMLFCGFRYLFPRDGFANPVEIGFETDGLIHLAARLRLVG